jgi:hypothetical protein
MVELRALLARLVPTSRTISDIDSGPLGPGREIDDHVVQIGLVEENAISGACNPAGMNILSESIDIVESDEAKGECDGRLGRFWDEAKICGDLREDTCRLDWRFCVEKHTSAA